MRLAHECLVRCWLAIMSATLLALSGLAHAQNLETALMPGQVIRGHAKVEEECKRCHVPFEKNAQDRLCVDCHKDISVDLQQKRGLHGKQQRAACRTCHTDHKGRAADILKFDKASFKHDSLTEYRLDGAHKTVKCEGCHTTNKKYREAPKLCDGCHRKDDVHKGSLGPKCEACHVASATSGSSPARRPTPTPSP